MKKIISILIILCLCFVICACKGGETPSENNNVSTPNSSVGQSSEEKKQPESSSKVEESSKTSEPDRGTITAFASARKFSTKAVSQKRTLNNTVYKLKNDKKLNVVYFGGSVTWGASSTQGNSWASKTGKWLKESYPDANITSFNTALGGTSAYFGTFRFESDVLPCKPDLMFIEFAVNDRYEGMTYSESVYYFETLIKKVNENLPQTDVIVLLITDKSKLGKEFENGKAHKAVADHYGIPCIDVGAELAKVIKSEGSDWADYIADYVHPNDAGHGMYATFIIEELKTMMAIDAKALKNHVLPEEDFVIGGVNTKTQVITTDKVKRGDWKRESGQCRKYTTYLQPSKKGDKLTIEFEGVSFGVYLTTAKGNTVVATIDGKEREYIVMPDTEGEHERLVFDNLIKGKHKVEIEYVSSGDVKIYAFFIG